MFTVQFIWLSSLSTPLVINQRAVTSIKYVQYTEGVCRSYITVQASTFGYFAVPEPVPGVGKEVPRID